jgi:hypothetical protein
MTEEETVTNQAVIPETDVRVADVARMPLSPFDFSLSDEDLRALDRHDRTGQTEQARESKRW